MCTFCQVKASLIQSLLPASLVVHALLKNDADAAEELDVKLVTLQRQMGELGKLEAAKLSDSSPSSLNDKGGKLPGKILALFSGFYYKFLTEFF